MLVQIELSLLKKWVDRIDSGDGSSVAEEIFDFIKDKEVKHLELEKRKRLEMANHFSSIKDIRKGDIVMVSTDANIKSNYNFMLGQEYEVSSVGRKNITLIVDVPKVGRRSLIMDWTLLRKPEEKL